MSRDNFTGENLDYQTYYVVIGWKDYNNNDNWNFTNVYQSKNLEACRDYVKKNKAFCVWNTLTIEEYDDDYCEYTGFKEVYEIWTKGENYGNLHIKQI